ncbi:transcriptional regulator [Streptomyces sp. NBC_01016]|uniref:ArsR family transcriptional regulator n=1 Tax=Streptomyces sp. NBC_01016 TaxID=2903720 RepID=UPI00224E9791|nr:ArsR family transcriptional regulator [Streptomyces sp. NBC_01016]MCX4827159.1 transcriptional regulator [Streptomyces sp. NBC_01016]MCX4832352.1 transcriptional regulator [Streptomyces sp. NBC_01016]
MSRTIHSQPADMRQAGIEQAYRELLLKLEGEPSVRELADAVGVTPSTISLQLKKMRERGIDIRTRGWRRRRMCPHCGGDL